MVDFAPEADRVACRLREEIVDGARRPGSKLVERELAAEMGVSRVPVRDALKMLIAEGLATPRPRSWTVVREFSVTDIDELIEVRSALETLAFGLAAKRRTPEQLERLAACLRIERAAAQAGDARTARRAGADFHETVLAMAANRLLSELYDQMRARMRWLLGQHSALAAMADEHAELYDAVAAADPDRATRLSAAHVASSRRAAAAHQRGGE